MQDTGLEFQYLLTRYACERFLYRLGASSLRDRCILKGASLLAVWMDEPYRATRDIDVLALDGSDESYVRQVVATICEVPCAEDAMTFDLSSVRVFPIRAGQEQPSQRVKLTSRLGNARIPVQVDIGFGDIVVPGPEDVQFPTLLDGMAAPAVRAYPRVSSVAEKFEAIVQLGMQNSRMKDFHDIWALSETFSFDGSLLREAIRACFARRATDWTTQTPLALTSTFYADTRLNRLWSDYRTSTNPVIAPPDAFDGNPDPLEFGEDGERGAVIATIGTDGSIARQRQRVASSEVHDLELDVSGCASQQEVRRRLAEISAELSGVARLIITGELDAAIDLRHSDLREAIDNFDAVQVYERDLRSSYDVTAIRSEPTIRGQFVTDVLEARLPAKEERRVLMTGLRALEGRRDLEVL